MSNYIDPEKFASALVSSTNFKSPSNSIAPGKVNVEKALKIYVEAVDKAIEFNNKYSEKQNKQNSQEFQNGLEILNNLKF